MSASPDACRAYRKKLKKRAMKLIGHRCVWCNTNKEVHAAHIMKTGLNGSGRGLERRYKDVVKHPDSYRPMCRKHHIIFDALMKVIRQEKEEPIPF